MKKIAIIALSIFALGFTSCNDDDDGIAMTQVPNEVVTAFEVQFPNATDVEYAQMGNQYVVDFDLNSVDYDALFNADGTLVQFKYDILVTEIPQEILTTITTDYDGRPIDDAEVLVIGDATYYQIELNNIPLDDYLVFNTDGTVNTTIEYWES